MINVIDRVPSLPGRILITPENGDPPYYATIARADDPSVIGTPLNKELFDSIRDDLAKRLQFTIPAQTIPRNSDLNDYSSPGEWAFPSDSVYTAINCPFANLGAVATRLIVFEFPYSVIMQFLFTSVGEKASRIYYSNSGTWGEWEITRTDDWKEAIPVQYTLTNTLIDIPGYRRITTNGDVYGIEAEIRIYSPTYITGILGCEIGFGEDTGGMGFSRTAHIPFNFFQNYSTGYLHIGHIIAPFKQSQMTLFREPSSVYDPQVIQLQRSIGGFAPITQIQIKLITDSGAPTSMPCMAMTIYYRTLYSQ